MVICDGCQKESEKLLNNNQTNEALCLACLFKRHAKDENFLRFCKFCEAERHDAIDVKLPFKRQCLECLAWACPDCSAIKDGAALCADCYAAKMEKD